MLDLAARRRHRSLPLRHVVFFSFSFMLCAVPAEERYGLSDVIKFKLNTSGVTGDDVISARLGVYIRRLRSASSSSAQRRWGSQHHQRRLTSLARVQVSDVTRLQQVHSLRRRPVYNVRVDGQWIMFEASTTLV